MRNLRSLALFLILPLVVAAQTPATPIPPAPTNIAAQPAAPAVDAVPRTTIPSDSNFRARPANDKGRDRVAAAKGHPVDILFVATPSPRPGAPKAGAESTAPPPSGTKCTPPATR
ncbi:MAG: hypothetical protein M3O31_05925 [Acidobacteriota bacterium]|nr:hypothetical protein [Acidobacteriota bacterium]